LLNRIYPTSSSAPTTTTSWCSYPPTISSGRSFVIQFVIRTTRTLARTSTPHLRTALLPMEEGGDKATVAASSDTRRATSNGIHIDAVHHRHMHTAALRDSRLSCSPEWQQFGNFNSGAVTSGISINQASKHSLLLLLGGCWLFGYSVMFWYHFDLTLLCCIG
jgi:hypothetical protein